MFEIGESLREARLRRGVEIAQAEEATKVRGKYLRALEDERFDVLPSQTYVKGFLRTYADYLGLDGQIYLDEYNSRFATGEDGGEPRVRRSRVRPSKRNRHLETGVVIVALVLITAATLAVFGAWTSRTPPVKHHSAPPKAATKPRAAVAGLSITAVGGDSYAAVRKDGAAGAVLFHDTIPAGKTETFSGDAFWINVASPENLVIKVRGKLVGAGAYRPAVVTVTPTGWHVQTS